MQFTHVMQVYETVFTFSLLALLVQRIIIVARSLEESNEKAREAQYKEAKDWQARFTNNEESGEERKRKASEPLDEGLKTNLHDEKAQPQDKRIDQRESIKRTVSESNFPNAGQLHQPKPKSQEEIEDEDTPQRKDNSISNRNSKKSIEKFEDRPRKVSQMQRMEPINQERQQDSKAKYSIRYSRRIEAAFTEYVPIIMCVVFVGGMTMSVYIFSMFCFFGYVFASLLFNYANLFSRVRGVPEEDSFYAKGSRLIAGLFIIFLFISYFISNQFTE